MGKKLSLVREGTQTFNRAKNVVIARAFIVGVVLAVLLGLFGTQEAVAPYRATLVSLLVVAGLIVGMFNISKDETNNYLLAAVSLVIVSSLGSTLLGEISGVGMYLRSVFTTLMAFVVPAVVIVALRAVYYVSRD